MLSTASIGSVLAHMGISVYTSNFLINCEVISNNLVNYLIFVYMLFTDDKSVSSTYKVMYHIYICLYQVCLLAHTEFCIIYMLFTASFGSVCSTYRVILYYYVYFLQPLLGLPLAHIVILYYYVYFLQPLLGLPLAHRVILYTMYTFYSLF